MGEDEIVAAFEGDDASAAVREYMLDACICSFIMRKRPLEVLKRLEGEVEQGHRASLLCRSIPNRPS